MVDGGRLASHARPLDDSKEPVMATTDHKGTTAVTKALLVRIRAKEGREGDVEGFLNQGLSLVGEEPKTVRWFAVRFGPSEFGIFDAFPDDDGRRRADGRAARRDRGEASAVAVSSGERR